jgi:galactokinase
MSTQFRAPARINIIGEHTDYNDGLVLPTTTALETRVVSEPRDDRMLVVRSAYANESRTLDLDNLEKGADSHWMDYVRGVAVALMEEGITLRGADLQIDSDIPVGGGLSSSAALEVSVALALLDACGESLDALQLAKACQRAESDTVGLKCGIMDQFASVGCQKGSAMLIDCRTLEAEFADIPDSAAFLVVDSGVKHRLPDGEYNDRREDCEQALQTIRAQYPGVDSLCDVSLSQLSGAAEALGETLYRRASHVITENQRVAESLVALRRGDLQLLGSKISESHVSLCKDFAVSCDESDKLVELLVALPGVYGARQVGAGFGGCVIALSDVDSVAAVRESISQSWGAEIGEEPWTHIVQPVEPAGPA